MGLITPMTELHFFVCSFFHLVNGILTGIGPCPNCKLVPMLRRLSSHQVLPRSSPLYSPHHVQAMEVK